MRTPSPAHSPRWNRLPLETQLPGESAPRVRLSSSTSAKDKGKGLELQFELDKTLFSDPQGLADVEERENSTPRPQPETHRQPSPPTASAALASVAVDLRMLGLAFLAMVNHLGEAD